MPRAKQDVQDLQSEEHREIHAEALERFEIVHDKERYEREAAIEDMIFANQVNGHYHQRFNSRLRSDQDENNPGSTQFQDIGNRPRFQINRVAPAIDQLVGDQRQNRTKIVVRPVGGASSEDIAKIYNGIIRNIEAVSDADDAYDNAYDEQVTGGFGGWRILTEFNDDDSFEQDILLEWIPSAASSLWLDPSSRDYRKRNWGFVTEWMTIQDLKSQYKNASITDFRTMVQQNTSCKYWTSDDFVQVAEYWRRVPITMNIGLLSDGRVIDLGKEEKVLDELKRGGIEVVREREAQSWKVEMYKMSGAELLEPKQDWAGKYVPLIDLCGKVTQIENNTMIRGITRFAKDPSRIYDWATSAAISAVAIAPKDPYWLTPKQASGHKAQFENFNVEERPFLIYTPDPDAPGPPQRGGAPSVQQALITQIQQAAVDIEATTGIHSASLGNAPQLLSERSVQSQAEKGDRGAFVFQDNLKKAKKVTANMLIDLIPKVMDTQRITRILNEDGTTEEVEINQEQLDEFSQPVTDEATGEVVIVNDLSVGKYEAISDDGPAFSTKKEQSVQQILELIQVSPRFEAIGLDLLTKNLDINDTDELLKRIRKVMIQEGTIDPTDEEVEAMGLDQPAEENPTDVAIRDNVLMDSEKKKAEIEKLDADTDLTRAKVVGEQISGLENLINSLMKKLDSGLPITQQEEQLKEDQEAVVQLSQDQL